MPVVEVRRADAIATVVLNRADRLNALTYEMIEELERALDDVARDPRIRVVVLTGAGRAFCAGLDLDEDLDREAEGRGVIPTRYGFQRRLGGLATALRRLPQPVIAAVHGPAVGGGFALALAADLRVLDTTASLSPAFIRIGLGGAEMGVSWLLPRVVGMSIAAELLLTGRTVVPDEALRLGLASRVVAEGDDGRAAADLAAEIASHSPLGVRMTKEVLLAGATAPDLESAIEIENRTQILCSLTEDFTEAVTAFHEKRPPVFGDR